MRRLLPILTFVLVAVVTLNVFTVDYTTGETTRYDCPADGGSASGGGFLLGACEDGVVAYEVTIRDPNYPNAAVVKPIYE